MDIKHYLKLKGILIGSQAFGLEERESDWDFVFPNSRENRLINVLQKNKIPFGTFNHYQGPLPMYNERLFRFEHDGDRYEVLLYPDEIFGLFEVINSCMEQILSPTTHPVLLGKRKRVTTYNHLVNAVFTAHNVFENYGME